MKKENSYQIWINAGYSLFAEEGHEGIQIERLARITGLNKSGFYHYFGDLHEFFKLLVKEHDRLIDTMVEFVSRIDSYDPGFFELMVQNKTITTFHIQLVRNRHVKIFAEAHDRGNKKIDFPLIPHFSKEVGIPEEFAYANYEILRDTFYTRVDLKKMNYEFLHSLFEDYKKVIAELAGKKSEVAVEPSLRFI